MKDVILCTKNVSFMFANDMHQQRDRVPMGSPLGPVLAVIIMVELEKYMVPKLKDHLFLEKVILMTLQHLLKNLPLNMCFNN